MESIKIEAIGLDRFIKQHNLRDSKMLKDEDIVSILKEMHKLIDINVELGYLDELKKEINSIKNYVNADLKDNAIIRYKDISNLKLKEIVLRIMEELEKQGLLIVIEPNANLFIDIDYENFLTRTAKCSSFHHVNMIVALASIQKNAIVNSYGKLEKYKLDKLREEFIVSTDFEKNPVLFDYMLKTLDYLDKFYLV